MKSFLFNQFQWLLNKIMPYKVSTNFYSKWAMFQITIINWKREHFLYSTKDPSQSLFWNQNFLLYLSNNNNRGLSQLTYQNSNLFLVLIDAREILSNVNIWGNIIICHPLIVINVNHASNRANYELITTCTFIAVK